MEYCLRPHAGRLRGGGDHNRAESPLPVMPDLQPQGMDSKRFFHETRRGGAPTGFTSYEACMPSATFGATAAAQAHSAPSGLPLSPGAMPAHAGQPSLCAGARAWPPHPGSALSPPASLPMPQFLGYHPPMMQIPLAAQQATAPMAQNITTCSHAMGVSAANAGSQPPPSVAAFAVPLPMPCTPMQPCTALPFASQLNQSPSFATATGAPACQPGNLTYGAAGVQTAPMGPLAGSMSSSAPAVSPMHVCQHRHSEPH
jgi:hypothetical protein